MKGSKQNNILTFTIYVVFALLYSCNSHRYVKILSNDVLPSKESIWEVQKNKRHIYKSDDDSLIIAVESTIEVQFNFYTKVDSVRNELPIIWIDSLTGYLKIPQFHEPINIEVNDDGQISKCILFQQTRYKIIRVIYYQEKLRINLRKTQIGVE